MVAHATIALMDIVPLQGASKNTNTSVDASTVTALIAETVAAFGQGAVGVGNRPCHLACIGQPGVNVRDVRASGERANANNVVILSVVRSVRDVRDLEN